MVNCIITGASRGIGYELCLELLNRECKVLAVSRSMEGLNKLMDQVRKQGFHERLMVLPVDLCQEEEVNNMVVEANTFLGKEVHVLINNAGTLVNKPLLELNKKDYEHVYNTNLWGPFSLIKTLYTKMDHAPWAHIVNISSVGGVQGSLKFPGLSLYSSSKGALNILTECLAEEMKESSIRCNALSLGAVQTEMLEEAFPDYKAPVGPKEMGSFIADFALNKWTLFNGKVISVSSSNP